MACTLVCIIYFSQGWGNIKTKQFGKQFKSLFTSWTMMLSLAYLKHVIGHWTRSKTTLVYIKKKIVTMTTELEVPKNPIFHAHVIHYHGTTEVTVGEAKEFFSLQMSKDHGKEMLLLFFFFFFFLFMPNNLQSHKERREEEGVKVKHGENFQNCPF